MPNITVTASAYPQNKEVTVISVKGFIDTTTAPEFEKVFQMALAEKKFNLVIDLKEVSYVSSAGWGIFVGEIKRIRSQKGDLFLVSMSPEVAEVFELLEFDSILKFFPTVDQAVQKGFAKVRAAKGAGKIAAEPETAKPQPQESFEPSPAGGGFQYAPADQTPKKSRWFENVLKPWKWF